MGSKYFYIVFFIILGDCKKHRTKDGKLVLNPVELVDLIIEEKGKTDSINFQTTDDVRNTFELQEQTTKGNYIELNPLELTILSSIYM